MKQENAVRMVALESWTGYEGKVKRGQEFTTSEHRAKELECPMTVRTSKSISGKVVTHKIKGKPRAYRVLDGAKGGKTAAPPASADHEPEEGAGDIVEDVRKSIPGLNVAELHQLRADFSEAAERDNTPANAAAIMEIDAELERRAQEEDEESAKAEQEKAAADDEETKGGKTVNDKTGSSGGKPRGQGKAKAEESAGNGEA